MVFIISKLLTFLMYLHFLLSTNSNIGKYQLVLVCQLLQSQFKFLILLFTNITLILPIGLIKHSNATIFKLYTSAFNFSFLNKFKALHYYLHLYIF